MVVVRSTAMKETVVGFHARLWKNNARRTNGKKPGLLDIVRKWQQFDALWTLLQGLW